MDSVPRAENSFPRIPRYRSCIPPLRYAVPLRSTVGDTPLLSLLALLSPARPRGCWFTPTAHFHYRKGQNKP